MTNRRISTQHPAQPKPPIAVAAEQVLPDYLDKSLAVIFVGINPGLASAAKRHHYAGKTNLFWPLLRESGFVPGHFGYENDSETPAHGVGLTNLVDRPSRGQDDLSRDELRAGAANLRDKLTPLRAAVICFNGKAIYQAFAGGACDFGLQPERFHGAAVFVMPSTSARAATYRREDKLRFFQELKRLVDREAARPPEPKQ